MTRPLGLGLAAGIALSLASSSAEAQTFQAWVDPTFGNGGGGTVSVNGVPAAANAIPFLTIGAAIGAIAGASGAGGNPTLSAANTGLVHCMPGIYSPLTNGEPLPIQMVDFISLQGTAGARGSIVVGFQTQPYGGPGVLPGVAGIYLPTVPNSRSTQLEVLVDGSGLTDLFPEMIDGFTFRGGHVQLYLETELTSVAWTISNCVLDMLNLAPEPATSLLPVTPIPGPWFGLLQVADYNVNPAYNGVRTNFLNNTVVMGWQGGPDAAAATATCLPGAVGTCDVTDPLNNPAYPPFGPDPLVRQSGLSPMNVQNTIYRTLPTQAGSGTMAMIGVDQTDTSVGVGSRVGSTDAFDATLVGATSGVLPTPPGSPPPFSSTVPTGANPVPWIDVNPLNPPGASGLARDPAFVGEFLSRQPTANAVDATLRDWRILPASLYVDAGSAPNAAGLLIAANGIAFYANPAAVNALLNSFDFDGEGYGNARIAVSPVALVGPAGPVDIGFDEASNLTLARSHGNDSIAHNTSAPAVTYPLAVGPGQAPRTLLVPGAGSLTLYNRLVPVLSGGGVTPVPPWSTIPSAVFPATPLPPPFPVGYGSVYVAPPFTPLVTLPATAQPPYSPPFEAGVVGPPLVVGAIS
ncbi:MAG: hypothetical protein ACF8XB_20520, partial [Planctomycetota bacterium JB042]